MKVHSGLSIVDQQHLSIKGDVGYLCHPASVDHNYIHGIEILKSLFGNRLKKLFSPQHGIFSDVQDNMVESNHSFHEYHQLPVYSLYSETRKPTADMLEGLDHVIIDLQDVGTRVYTYIYTMIYMMEACGENGVDVIVLDRSNPIGGEKVEGNVLDMNFRSFVGRYPMPMRHGMTIGEVALMAQRFWKVECDLKVIKMEGWKRNFSYWDTGFPWVLPSPNLANVETAFTFVGTVIFEGTNVSEGRGTTKSLEIVGHPKMQHHRLAKKLKEIFRAEKLSGFILRPVSFIPTFQKHEKTLCHGFQIHVIDYSLFEPWKVGQVLCREIYHHLGDQFLWKQPPYEYEENLLPIDILNGTDRVRNWVEKNGDFQELVEIENEWLPEFLEKRKEILLY